MKKVLILIIISLSFFSCSKDGSVNTEKMEDSFLDYFTNKGADNHITIFSSSINGNVASITVTKNLEDPKLKSKYAARSYFGLEKKNVDVIEYFFKKDKNFKKALDVFGSRISLSENTALYARGTSVPKAETMYVPELISIENPEKNRFLDKGKDLKLSWNPDFKNPIDKVVVLIINRGYMEGNQTVNAEKLYIKKVVDDTGSFTLSKEELKKFKEDTYLDVIVSRGNQLLKDDVLHTAVTSDLIFPKVINSGR